MFSQNITKIDNSDLKNYNWKKNATCYGCDKKGHIIHNYPNINSKKYDDGEITNKDNNKSREKYSQTKEKKPVQVLQETDN